jgi:hypothetical protein
MPCMTWATFPTVMGSVARGDDCVGEFGDRPHTPDVSDEIFLALLLDEPAGGVLVRVGDGALDFFERQIVGAEFLGIDLHLILHAPAANGDGVRDSGNRQEAWADGPVRQQAEFDRREFFALQPMSMISPMIEEIGPICGSTPAGRRSRVEASFSRDELPREVDVGTPVELDEDDGQTHAGNRPDALHATGTVERGLDGERDESLDFLGSEALGLGQDRDLRPVEVGKHVHGQPRHFVEAIECQDERRDQDEEAVLDREVDGVLQHGDSVSDLCIRSGRKHIKGWVKCTRAGSYSTGPVDELLDFSRR